MTIPGPRSALPSMLKMLFKKNYSLWDLGHELQRDYGDVVRFKPPFAAPVMLIADADVIGRLLTQTEKSVIKGKIVDRLKLFLGEGLFTAKGDHWRASRHLINPAFLPSMMARMSGVIEEEATAMVRRWQEQLKASDQLDLSEEMTRLAFAVISRVLFSADATEHAGRMRDVIAQVQELANVFHFAPFMLPLWVPTKFNRRVLGVRRLMTSITQVLIDEHKAHPDRYSDLLSVLLSGRDPETGQGLSDHQIRDEVITMIIAGHETTAAALSMGLEALSRQPQVVEAMRAEYRRGPAVAPADYAKLTYTGQVSQEILRLYSPIWAMPRQAEADLQVKGYAFKKGDTMLLLPFLMHRHPEHWRDAARFDPARFSVEDGVQRHPFAYFPFGGGVRGCIGSALAKAEIALTLRAIVSHFELHALPGFSYRPMPRVTTSAEPNIRIRLARYEPGTR